MKKIFYFANVIIIATTLFSCSNIETISDEETNKISQVDTNDLLYRIDNINNKYQAKKSIKKIKPETVNKWGGKILSAVVDGLGGYIAGPAGWLVGPLCSWAFDAHWENCNRDVPHTKRPRKICINDSINFPTYVVSKKECLTHIDSIGYYHNLMLDKLSHSGNNYVYNDSTINYNLIYEDCEKASKELAIETPQNEDKAKLISLSKHIVEEISNCNDDIDLENAFETINKYYSKEFNIDEDIIITEKVQKKILSVINEMEDENDIKEYANKIYDAIYKSSVTPELKEKASIANSVTVNSKLYWENTNKECQNANHR